MSSVADLVEREADHVLGRVRDRLEDVRLHELAARVVYELVRSLRAANTTLPAFETPVGVDALTEMLREVCANVLDAIESEVTAKDLRRVAEWFAAATERSLRDANRRFGAMLDALDDHLLLLDARSHVLFLNLATEGSARESYGLSRDEMVGRHTLEGAPSPFKQYITGLAARASTGETIAEEFLLPMPGGAVWHEHRYHPVRRPDGEVEAVAVASRDIHARKQAEGRLLLLSKIGLLAETTELDSMLVRAAGLAIPELADWSVFELVHEGEIIRSTIVHPDAARAVRADSRLAEWRSAPARRVDGVELGGRVYELGQADDGALRARDPELHALLRQFEAATAIVVPFFVMGAPIAVATFVFGPESGRRHTISDLAIADEIARRAAQIVENARLQSEVAQALAYRERVMGILGHDLRNPVSAVLSLSATLVQRADVPDRTKEGLRHIRKSAERMEQMIATILDFTQLRFRGLPSLALETFDLETLVRTIVEELRAGNPSRTIAIEAHGELRGRWDVSRLGQVVSNLVGNALTHGALDSPVTVGLTAEGDRVLVAVTNHGPTIPTDALGKLFEPFWQAPRSGVPKSRGLGLGLFIAQQIVEAHGGDIAVRSQNDHTTFTVRLPR
ncbi:MAG TPA: ATP-binding protein [Kofleriaceae bacterium]|jgi:PAS domain S-box-containing protein